MTNALLENGAFSVCTMNGKTAGTTLNRATTNDCCVVPKCEIRIEECADGCKIICTCDDEVARKTMQNLWRAMAGGLCSVCCTWNGMTVCQCDFVCCHCTCEMTADGVCISCRTGDKTCQEMLKAMCKCLCKCQDCGCASMVCLNGTPICHCSC